MPKNHYIRRIDIPKVGAFDAGGDALGTAAVAPPVQAAIGPPTNLVLSTAIERNAVTPTAQIGATWYPPAGVAPTSYVVQWSTSSLFPDPGTNGQGASAEATTIGGLIPATLYYVRVLAFVASQSSEWSATASITTAADVTPPDPPVGGSAGFQGIGDLWMIWGNPASANFRTVEIKIYASSGGALLATLYDATERRVWTAAENLAATGGAGDPTLYIELRSLSWGGIFSTLGMSGPVTKAAPAAPTIAVDFTGADAVYTITPPADAARLSFVADTGVTARVIAVAGRYVYPFDQNRLDHSGTPDPVLAYSFTAVDGLNQASTATTGTATNAAPSAPTITLTGGFAQLVCQVTSAKAVDFLSYEYVWKRDTVTQRTLESASSEQQYETGAVGDEGSHSWTCTVRQKDVFNQFSTATASSAVVLDTLTIGYLRSGAFYSDSDANTYIPPNGGTLAALKDGSTSAGGVTYGA